MNTAAILALYALSSGCSIAGVRAPAPHVDCTHSFALPMIDTLPAAVGVLGGGGIMLADGGGTRDDPFIVIGPAMLVTGALYALSAWWGYSTVSRCLATDPAASPPNLATDPATSSRPDSPDCGGQGLPRC